MSKPDIVILYGSQTGNAEDLAKRIGYKAKDNGYSILVQAMDDFPIKSLVTHNAILFICSTTGHGQEPENMRKLYNFMRRPDLPDDCLTNLNYAVYGLGDSSYVKFNYISKILFKRLKACGAKPIQDLIVADEQHPYGCDGAIYPKLEQFWSRLECICERDKFLSGDNDTSIKNSYNIKFMSKDDKRNSIDPQIFNDKFVERKNIKTAFCYKNVRVTSQSHFQDTRYLCFKAADSIYYEPGDVVSIYPANSDKNVLKFANLLNLDLEQRLSIEKIDPNYMVNYLYDFVPNGITIKELIKYYFDIQSVPKRSFFEFLWPMSKNTVERDKLKEFATTEGQEELYQYCILPKRSILEVLVDFPNTVEDVQFNCLFDMIPPIKPRSFSIASCPQKHPNEIHLIVGVVGYKTRLRKIRRGLCSNYLATKSTLDSSSEQSCIRFYIHSTSFKLPKQSSRPIIMVGPGLGIAPFRSFLQRRIDIEGVSGNYLYFGCRKPNSDFYFEPELIRYKNSDKLDLKVAFSRLETKQYVQDLIKHDALKIKRLILDERAALYIAGNSKLPDELRALIGKILFHDEIDDSNKLVAQLESSNTIMYDCW